MPPLHIVCNSVAQVIVKPFRFLNFWTKHKKFKEVVQSNWSIDFMGNPLMELHAKLQKKALTDWSRAEFGNIFLQVATLEDIIKVKEAQLEIMPSSENRTELCKVEADLRKYLKLEEEYWKQKAGLRWFSQGDKSTKFFHSSVQGKRRKLHLSEISDEQGCIFQTNSHIGEAAVSFFKGQFEDDRCNQNISMLKHIPKLLTDG